MENKRSIIGILVVMAAWMGGSLNGSSTVTAFSPLMTSIPTRRIMMGQQSHQRFMSTTNGGGSDETMDPVQAVVNAMYGGTTLETPDKTRARIQDLVQQHPVLLFMKGSKLFPQCGFSDTATKILDALKVDFHAVDVLADPAIRQGIKDFSQWPTIPQLYVRGEFIGGSDIMLEMYQNGELVALVNETES